MASVWGLHGECAWGLTLHAGDGLAADVLVEVVAVLGQDVERVGHVGHEPRPRPLREYPQGLPRHKNESSMHCHVTIVF
jgi:hypothetical protein